MKIMCINRFAGMKTYKSSKGNTFADCFFNPLNSDGSVDFEQIKVRTFQESVIAKLQVVKAGTDILCSVEVKDPVLNDIEVVEDDD